MSKNLYIYCEGPTEESFINKILAPYFLNLEIYVTPIICTTKRTSKQKFKGGVTTYSKFRKELKIICQSHSSEYVTTMFDYYAFPDDTPMIDCKEKNLLERMKIIQNAISNDINQNNCMINLTLHEFESLLFSNPSVFEYITNSAIIPSIQKIRNEFETPEHINNSAETAPSKRLLRLIPNYSKVSDGTTLGLGIGIDKIMEECPHFANWINMLKEWLK